MATEEKKRHFKKCKHCHQRLRGSSHHCDETGRTYEANDDGDFPTSMAVGWFTGSAIAGWAVGGDLLGGVIGSMFSD